MIPLLFLPHFSALPIRQETLSRKKKGLNKLKAVCGWGFLAFSSLLQRGVLATNLCLLVPLLTADLWKARMREKTAESRVQFLRGQNAKAKMILLLITPYSYLDFLLRKLQFFSDARFSS